MNRKMIIFDVDGTICAGSLLPSSAARAIRSIREAGHIAVFFTGRPYTHVDRRVTDIGFDACVCTMGAYIRIGDRVIQDLKPSPGDTRKIIEIVRGSGLDAVYESDKGVGFDRSRPFPQFLEGVKKHFLDIGLDTDMDIDGEGFSFDKLCLFRSEESCFEAAEERLPEYLELVGKKENMEEWAVKGLSTRSSIEIIKEFFHMDKENCYAIGDSITDLPMLEAAAHTIAMGQGHEELKEKVEYVTAPVDEDGLARAMMHYGLIESI